MLNETGILTWTATLVVVLVCAWIALGMVQRRRSGKPDRVIRLKKLLVWSLSVGSVAFLFWAYEAWTHASHAPHLLRTGTVETMQRIVVQGDEQGMLACIGDCNGELVYFSPDALRAIEPYLQTPLTVGFLMEHRQISTGIYGFDVVDVWDPAHGSTLYHQDTHFHPLQLSLLALDAVLLAVTAWLCIGLVEEEPEEESATALPGTPIAAAPSQPVVADLPLIDQPAGAPLTPAWTGASLAQNNRTLDALPLRELPFIETAPMPKVTLEPGFAAAAQVRSQPLNSEVGARDAANRDRTGLERAARGGPGSLSSRLKSIRMVKREPDGTKDPAN